MATKRTLEIAEIIKLYRDGIGTGEIASRANISVRGLNKLLTKQNIEKRTFGYWKRQYSVNEHYFKTWSSDMAYILGFFVADGFIASHLQQVSFAQKEKYILEDIRDEMGSNHPIFQNKNTGVYMLNINSMVMKRDLINIHGMTPKKSYDVRFPTLPEDKLSHFIRGYFDGDGCITTRDNTISFVGASSELFKSLKEVLEKQGFEPKMSHKGKIIRLKLNGRKPVKLFADWIYQDKGLYLKRKYEIFQLK